MAVDKLVDSTQLNAELTSVANAIRAKGGTSASLAFPAGFVDAIEGIETGGGVTVSPLSVTANGTYTAPSGEAYSPVTVNVSGGGGQSSASPKAVNFIDYDGTILYSYSESDALALTELPANPSHSGLTAQGWNWTLAQIKAQLTAMPGAPVWVGQMYITDDAKTRIYCRFETGRLAPYLGLGVNGTVTVDWGDGSSTDTLTGTSLTTAKTVQHIYSEAGYYTITLTVESGSFAFFGESNAAHILKKSTAATANVNRVYANSVQRIELGTNASIGSYAFGYCSSLASITIPNGVTSIDTYAFNYCYSLTSITIPNGVTSINDQAFYSCYSLASITIPDGMTGINDRAFYNCYSLASITIPDGVTGIRSSAFGYCYGLGEIHFLPTTPPRVFAKDVFTNLQSDCKIYVPAGTLAAYTSATNYPSSSTYTYIEE